MIYCFDIDGTLCTEPGDYEAAQPMPAVIREINALHAAGHRILLWTGRGTVTGDDYRPLTERQLAAWGVRYDELRFGKPAADLYVDNRGINIEEWMRGK